MESAELFKCLGDPTRLRIVHLLANRGPELCVCKIVATLELPQSTVSRQLMMLRHLDVVRDRREANWMHYSLAEPSSAVHRAIIRCLGSCLQDDPVLSADLKRYDKLTGKQKKARAGKCPAGVGRTVR
jgi:ArsR family transcriptional regulator